MLELEEQLRRYGEAIERELLDRADGLPVTPVRHRRRTPRLFFAAAAALVFVG